MKKRVWWGWAALCCVSQGWADALHKASAQDVAMLLNAATGMNSAYEATLIGETPNRIYIEYVTAIHLSSMLSNTPKTVVYWLPRSEITQEQLLTLQTLKAQAEQRRQNPQMSDH